MDEANRSLRNPVITEQSARQQVPTEQNVYATASLYRAIAYTNGKHTRELLPGLVTGNPPADEASLIQMALLGYRRST